MRLRHHDWKRLFNATAKLYSDIEPATLRERALATSNELVSGELPAFNFFDGLGADTREYWHDPGNAPTAAETEIFASVAHEHPFFPEVFGKGRRDTMKMTDFMSPAQFRKTAIYNEFYSRLPIRHQLSVALDAGDNLIVTCSINRKAGDFTEEERLMFDLIAPHLANAIKNGRKIERLLEAEANLNSVLEAKSVGVIKIGIDRKVSYISPLGRSLVERYFSHGLFQGEYLPESLSSWVKQNDSDRRDILDKVDLKFVLASNDSELNITLMPNGNANETILILEDVRKASPLDLAHLGMTKRQTEVLFWMSQGKTDRDIASLLGISHRTIHKHTENIYVKLGVETRTAAVLVAAKRLGARWL